MCSVSEKSESLQPSCEPRRDHKFTEEAEGFLFVGWFSLIKSPSRGKSPTGNENKNDSQELRKDKQMN